MNERINVVWPVQNGVQQTCTYEINEEKMRARITLEVYDNGRRKPKVYTEPQPWFNISANFLQEIRKIGTKLDDDEIAGAANVVQRIVIVNTLAEKGMRG